MQTPLSHAHQSTRNSIFAHPAPHNLHWRDVRSLLVALADELSEQNGRLTVIRAGHPHCFHTEHGPEVASWDDLKHLRTFLTQAGYGAEQTDDPTDDQADHQANGHGEARSQGESHDSDKQSSQAAADRPRAEQSINQGSGGTNGQGPDVANPGRAGGSQRAGEGPLSREKQTTANDALKSTAGAATTATSDDAAKLTPPEESGVNLLVVIDHREARIYRTELRGTVPYSVTAEDLGGTGRHLHRVDREANGQRRPEQTRFYNAIAAALTDADAILLFGSATGASSAMEHLQAALLHHHPLLAAKIIGSVTVDETHLTEPQLLAQAREVYAAHWAAQSSLHPTPPHPAAPPGASAATDGRQHPSITTAATAPSTRTLQPQVVHPATKTVTHEVQSSSSPRHP